MGMGLEVDGTALDEALVPVQGAGSSIVTIEQIECQSEQGLTKAQSDENGCDECEIE